MKKGKRVPKGVIGREALCQLVFDRLLVHGHEPTDDEQAMILSEIDDLLDDLVVDGVHWLIVTLAFGLIESPKTTREIVRQLNDADNSQSWTTSKVDTIVHRTVDRLALAIIERSSGIPAMHDLPEPSAEECALDRIRRRVLQWYAWEQINRLGPRTRACVAHALLPDMTQAEIAFDLGVSRAAVHAAIRRAEAEFVRREKQVPNLAYPET